MAMEIVTVPEGNASGDGRKPSTKCQNRSKFWQTNSTYVEYFKKNIMNGSTAKASLSGVEGYFYESDTCDTTDLIRY